MIASKLYGRFVDLSPLYSFLWQLNANYLIQFANIIFSKTLLNPYFILLRSAPPKHSFTKERFTKENAGHSAPRLHAPQLKQPPQNQLHLAECTCRKSCMVGCEVTTAKS
jgi:hypothetical protein